MVVAEGYKKTEVGVIPEDWEISSLDTVATIIDPQPDHRTPQAIAGGEPYIGISDFIDDHTVNWTTCRKIVSSAVDKQQRSFNIQAGDIVFGKIGTIGQPKFLPQVPFRYALSANILLIQPKIDPKFLMAWLKSGVAQDQINRELHSTSQAAFGIQKMQKLLVAFPPNSEKKAIASALSDVDALIQTLEKLIAKKQAIKTATMQQLLTGKTRLPGFGEGKGYKETEIGVIPEDWDIHKLMDLTSKIGSGITPTGGSAIYEKEGRPFIRSQNIGWGNLLLNDVAYIADAIHSSFSATEIKTGDVFLNITGASIGRSAVAQPAIVGGNVNQHVCIIRVIPSYLDSDFLNSLLLSELCQKQIDSFQAGGNREGLNFGQVGSFQIPCPPINEQKAIASLTSGMTSELEKLTHKLRKNKAIKQGMMQELLTGKTRLV